jgi:hypothetical protein
MHINICNQVRYVTDNVSKMGVNVNNLKFDNSSTREELYINSRRSLWNHSIVPAAFQHEAVVIGPVLDF